MIVKSWSKRFGLLLATTGLLFAVGCDDKAQKTESLTNKDSLSQFAAVVRGAIPRMVVTEGISLNQIKFDRPDELRPSEKTKLQVFASPEDHVTYRPIPAHVMIDEKEHFWIFNANLAVKGFNKNPTADQNETIVFANGLKKEACLVINQGKEIPGIPKLQSDQSKLYTQDAPYSKRPLTYLEAPELEGHWSGCFQGTDGTYTFYGVIIER